VWFSGDYDLPAILPLWDAMIARNSEYNHFMDALCIAHIAQIPGSLDCVAILETKLD
jgi:hypothetical protein